VSTTINRPPSPFYSSPALYQLLIRFLYRKYFNERYQVVADEIPAGCSVVDVCAGEAFLYLKYLKKKSVTYIAVDNSPHFAQWGLRRGIDYRKLNVFIDKIPTADVVIMMASLYQFYPHEKETVQKLIRSARKKVIITEPISNLSSSQINFIAKFANWLTTPFEVPPQYTGERFDEKRLVEFLSSFSGFQGIEKIAGGREMVAVIKGEADS
jgi:hypothetical protein